MTEQMVTDDRSRESIMSLLKRHRMTAGLDGKQVAKRVGVTQSTYSAWETGTHRPKPKHFKKLAQVLDIDPMTLTRVMFPESDSQPGESGNAKGN